MEYGAVAADAGEYSAVAAPPSENFSVLVGNRTGGQGKTVVSMLLASGLRRAGIAPTLVSVDAGEDGDASKLASLDDGVIDLMISADLGVIAKKGVAAVRHWDGFASVLTKRNVVIDLGANASGPLFRWAEVSDLADLTAERSLNLVVPVTAQQNSARDALAVLRRSVEVGAQLNIARRVVVFNEAHGEFDGIAGAMDELRAYVKENAIPTVTLPAALLEATDQGIGLSRLEKMTPDQYQTAMGFPYAMTAIRELRQLKEWALAAIVEFVRVGLLPEGAAKKI